jgi:predicted HicB family RNase H-like nuclease
MRQRRQEPTTKIRTKRLGVYLTPAMYRKLTHAAVDEGTSLTALVEGLVEHYLRGRRTG